MNKIKLFAIAILGVLVTSCATTGNNSAHSDFMPNDVRLNIDMHDMEYLGEVEVSITEDIYFGCIRTIRTVNGEKYDSWKNTTRTSLAGATWGHTAKGMDKATYKVLEKFPNADFFKVVRETSKTERMFGMKAVERTATIKAYRLKAGNHGITTCACNHDKK